MPVSALTRRIWEVEKSTPLAAGTRTPQKRVPDLANSPNPAGSLDSPLSPGVPPSRRVRRTVRGWGGDVERSALHSTSSTPPPPSIYPQLQHGIREETSPHSPAGSGVCVCVGGWGGDLFVIDYGWSRQAGYARSRSGPHARSRSREGGGGVLRPPLSKSRPSFYFTNLTSTPVHNGRLSSVWTSVFVFLLKHSAPLLPFFERAGQAADAVSQAQHRQKARGRPGFLLPSGRSGQVRCGTGPRIGRGGVQL